VLVQTKRNKRAALKLMRKLLKKYGVVPEKLSRMIYDGMLPQPVIAAAASESWHRKTSAAQSYFPPDVTTCGGKPFIFVDGSVIMYRNPATVASTG
jgi:hypothetical protein